MGNSNSNDGKGTTYKSFDDVTTLFKSSEQAYNLTFQNTTSKVLYEDRATELIDDLKCKIYTAIIRKERSVIWKHSFSDERVEDIDTYNKITNFLLKQGYTIKTNSFYDENGMNYTCILSISWHDPKNPQII